MGRRRSLPSARRGILPTLLALLSPGLIAIGAPPPASVSQAGQLPADKNPLVLRPQERNPFTRREVKSTEITTDRKSEESQLRALFRAMPVTGVIRGQDEIEVLLGNLILKTGQPIPTFLQRQTERLVVGPITAKQVELLFVENDAHAEPRKIIIPIDLHPHVMVHPVIPVVQASSETNTIQAPGADADPSAE